MYKHTYMRTYAYAHVPSWTPGHVYVYLYMHASIFLDVYAHTRTQYVMLLYIEDLYMYDMYVRSRCVSCLE